MSEHLEELFAKIRATYVGLRNSCARESLESHLRSLGGDSRTVDRDAKVPAFRDEITVAYATCACGAREFIVEGSTQECQHGGGLMFRHDQRLYRRTGGGG